MSSRLVWLHQEYYLSQVVECVCTRLYNLFKNKQFWYNWCACSCSSACDKSNKANNIILCFACFSIYVPYLVWIGIEKDQQSIWNAKGCHNLFTLYVLSKKSISIIQNPTFFKNSFIALCPDFFWPLITDMTSPTSTPIWLGCTVYTWAGRQAVSHGVFTTIGRWKIYSTTK